MSIRHRVEYVAWRGASLLVRALPLDISQSLAALLARMTFRLSRRHLLEALENLRIAFPDLDPGQRMVLARDSQIHLFWNLVDLVRMQSWGPADVERRCDLEGVEHLEAALARGKGAIILTLHLGNFELGALRFVRYGAPTLALSRPLDNPLLQRVITDSRERMGSKLIDRNRAAAPMLRHLRKNGVVAALNDRYARSNAVFAPLFGVRAATAAGIATLALRTGAAVVPAYITRDGRDHHCLRLLAAIESPVTGDRRRDIESAVAAHNAALERIILAHPEQWMWRHRRFRHSPDLVLARETSP